MSYKISDYSYQQASKLGVDIKPSTRKGKKIDVFKNGNKVASIGALGYGDYPYYMKNNPAVADRERKNYKLRHAKDRSVVGSAGFFADRILW